MFFLDNGKYHIHNKSRNKCIFMLNRIRVQLPYWPKALQKAGEYLVNNPHELAMMSLRQLADKAGVSPAAMVRLAKVLEYENFSSLQTEYRMQWRNHEASAYAKRASEVVTDTPVANTLLSALGNADIHNIQETLSQIDHSAFEQMIETFSRCKNLYVIGMRQSASLVSAFSYSCGLFTDKIIPLTEESVMVDTLRYVHQDDAALLIAFTPYAVPTVAATKYLREKGIKHSIISDAVTHLSASAECTIKTGRQGTMYLASMTAGMMVIQAVVMALIQKIGPAAIDALTDSEQHLKDFKAFYTPFGS
jgi:DNA-binding MurR/RpiR family transcriptional regulator